MAESVRDRVRAIQKDLRDGALTPDMARESEIHLTALYGNVMDEKREARAAYSLVYLAAFRAEGKANRAKLVAEVSPEFARLREVEDTETLVKQMVLSCRSFLRSLNEEMRLQRCRPMSSPS